MFSGEQDLSSSFTHKSLLPAALTPVFARISYHM